MKKLVMTFAIVAFLIGGLTLNASAQGKDKVSTNKKAKATVETPQKPKVKGNQTTPNYDQMLKDFETNIDKYIASYEKAMKGTADKNDFMTYQKKALDLQAKLEKAKDKLNQNQIDQFLKLKAKLAEALKRK